MSKKENKLKNMLRNYDADSFEEDYEEFENEVILEETIQEENEKCSDHNKRVS